MKRFLVEFVGPDDPRVAAALALEQEVFLYRFNNTPAVMDREYGPYTAQSRYMLVLDRENLRGGLPALARMSRIIVPGPAGLKSYNDLAGEPWNTPLDSIAAGDPQFAWAFRERGRTWDIATLAGDDEYTGEENLLGQLAGAAYFYALAQWTMKYGILCWLAVLDDIVLHRVIQPRLGYPFEYYRDPALGSRPYLDSPASTPVYTDTEAMQRRLARDYPDVYAMCFQGAGLTDLVDLVDDSGLTVPTVIGRPITIAEAA